MTLLASLRLLIVSTCAGLLLLTPAAAQIGGSTPVVNHPKELYSFEHYIHAVPRSPGDYQPITAEEVLETGELVKGQFMALLNAVFPRIAAELSAPIAPSKALGDAT